MLGKLRYLIRKLRSPTSEEQQRISEEQQRAYEEYEKNVRTLEDNLFRTMATLVPKFGITENRCYSSMPDYVFVTPENTGASSGPMCISVSQNFMHDAQTLGHEVSHNLHSLVRPCEVSWAETSFGKTLRELVADYGGFVNCVENALPMPGKEWTRGEGFKQDLPHKLGYLLAQETIRTYGDSLLPELARMSLDEARIAIPRLLPISFDEKMKSLFDSMGSETD